MGFIKPETVYQYLPIPLQNMAVSIWGYFWKKRRFGGIFNEEYKNFKNREFFNRQEWEEYQNQEITKLLLHAFQHVPYYRKTWQAAGWDLKKLNTIRLDNLYQLPALSKEDFRQYGKTSLIADNAARDGSFFSSSGSTGTPTATYYSKTMHRKWSAAFENRIRNWAGLNNQMPRGMVGGRQIVSPEIQTPPFHRYNFFEKQTYFSILHLSAANAQSYVDGMIEGNIDYLTGYAVSVYLLAHYIVVQNIKAPKLRAVITSSEALTDKMKKTITKAFNCPVFDSWSGIEGCALISECEKGALHISPDVGVVEILNAQGLPVNAGETGEIVCTGFLNRDQPLIRYKIGDLVTLSAIQSCACGRQMPVVSEIVGRTDDIVTLSNGVSFASFNRFFAEIEGVVEAQVVQENPDKFIVKVVCDHKATTFEQVETQIKSIFIQKLDNVEVFVEQLEKIPRGVNGKFKAVISNVKRDT